MPILAIQVEVNGAPVTVAGAAGLLSLTGMVSVAFHDFPGRVPLEKPQINLYVSGLSDLKRPLIEELRWIEKHLLKPGDAVTFRIVEVDDTSAPVRTVQSPSVAELKAAADREKKMNGPRSRNR